MKRVSEVFVIACFLGFLTAGLFFIVNRDSEFVSYFENRTLTAFPAYSDELIGNGDYAAQLERYLDDHAALRTTLLMTRTRLDLILHRPVVNEVVVTEDRLLPYLSIGAGTADTATVMRWGQNMADNLKRINDTVTEYGGYYCYVAVPCQYVYFEDDYPWYYSRKII